MRDFIDAILASIGSTSLTDVEYNSINFLHLSVSVYNVDLYNEIGKVLVSRETVSTITDRLKYLFLSKGTEGITPIVIGKTNIYLGDAL